jgi:hypothetical protein
VQNALDKRDDTGWAIGNEFGKPHRASFEFRDTQTGTTELLLVLEMKHPQIANHTIGRFRIYTTASLAPVKLTGPPEKIASILRLPPEKRSEDQKKELLNYYRGLDEELQRLNRELAEIGTRAACVSSVLRISPGPSSTATNSCSTTDGPAAIFPAEARG